ncbi:C1 family peptidase [bacterium]|nr:C1 family peptidase [bacterium]
MNNPSLPADPAEANDPLGSLSEQETTSYHTAFGSDPKNRLAMNAVTRSDLSDIAMDRDAFRAVDHHFSDRVHPKGDATSQKASGRCWLFAGLNVMRLGLMKEKNIKNIELSQSYLLFWDKYEKANWHLECIIQTVNEPLEGRLVSWLLANAVPDGGQWDMFVNLIEKYGVVPQSAMPESHSSSATAKMNRLLLHKLREWTKSLRDAHDEGGSLADLRTLKDRMMAEVYRILAIHIGEPPSTFDWQYEDKDEAFHRYEGLTPHRFRDEHLPFNVSDTVCLVHAPTEDKPLNTLLTVSFLGNVVGGHTTRYANVSLDTMKKAAIASIQAGEAVWFGCDVGKRFHRDLGVMDTDLYDYNLVLGTDTALTKADRLNYGDSLMTHAMVFTGVDLRDGKPQKWMVENSWGDKVGSKGYFIMTDAWFDEYNYEIVVSKRFVDKAILDIFDQDPIVLAPWDPMGALA